MRRGAKPAKAKVKAKLPVVRKSRESEGSRVRELAKRLAESLEQQTATAEIIRQQPDFGVSQRLSEALKFRAILSVPMMQDGSVVGAITVARAEARAFSEGQIELLQIFAAQAVIAIENVRLFNETKEALEQQTATSQILGVISRSPTDTQPVFEAIATNAARLCSANDAQEWVVHLAHYGRWPVATTAYAALNEVSAGGTSTRARRVSARETT
jgi:transcriptional regulator with GAF, ATPase, and Fis domain